MKKKFQIFISSTYTDLIKERQFAVEAVLRAKHIPAGMELFSAGNKSQLETIKKWIDESDIYILILGGRYGSIEFESGMSYTEIEYRYAIEKEKPFFSIVLDDSMLQEKMQKEGKNVYEFDNQEKYKKFKEFVLSKVCRIVKNDTEIQLSILESIIEIQSSNELVGWVKGNEIPDSSVFLNEIQVLRNERTELQNKVTKLDGLTKKSNDKYNIGDYTFSEVYNVLQEKKVIYPASFKKTDDETETNVLEQFLKNASVLTKGVFSVSTGDFYKFLSDNVIPILISFNLIEIVNVKAKDFQYDKYIISNLGHKFLSLIEINRNSPVELA